MNKQFFLTQGGPKVFIQSLVYVSRAYFTSIDIALSQYFLLIQDQNTNK